uniref:hypothetical protein n=1 Tax=Algoriphagus sp. TaxID=1872435 RepID=UPI00404867E9
ENLTSFLNGWESQGCNVLVYADLGEKTRRFFVFQRIYQRHFSFLICVKKRDNRPPRWTEAQRTTFDS